MAAAGIKTIIFLSFVLALGFLLVILGCALWAQWLPLLVAATFVLSPVPNLLAASCSYGDEFSADYSSAPGDAAKFLTGGLVATGVGMPLAMAHSGVIAPGACWMSMAGGALVYGTIIVYSHFFSSRAEEF